MFAAARNMGEKAKNPISEAKVSKESSSKEIPIIGDVPMFMLKTDESAKDQYIKYNPVGGHKNSNSLS